MQPNRLSRQQGAPSVLDSNNSCNSVCHPWQEVEEKWWWTGSSSGCGVTHVCRPCWRLRIFIRMSCQYLIPSSSNTRSNTRIFRRGHRACRLRTCYIITYLQLSFHSEVMIVVAFSMKMIWWIDSVVIEPRFSFIFSYFDPQNNLSWRTILPQAPTTWLPCRPPPGPPWAQPQTASVTLTLMITHGCASPGYCVRIGDMCDLGNWSVLFTNACAPLLHLDHAHVWAWKIFPSHEYQKRCVRWAHCLQSPLLLTSCAEMSQRAIQHWSVCTLCPFLWCSEHVRHCLQWADGSTARGRGSSHAQVRACANGCTHQT